MLIFAMLIKAMLSSGVRGWRPGYARDTVGVWEKYYSWTTTSTTHCQNSLSDTYNHSI